PRPAPLPHRAPCRNTAATRPAATRPAMRNRPVKYHVGGASFRACCGSLVAGRDPFVVVDHLGDDEVEELLREDGVEAGLVGEGAQAGDLAVLTGRIRRRKAVLGLEATNLLRALEPLGEQ